MDIKPNILINYLYTVYYTNKDTSKLDWEQIACQHTPDQVRENFEKRI